MNGDGFADIVVGAPTSSATAMLGGAAYFYLGSPAGPDAFADGTLGAEAMSDLLGNSLAGLGDANGDGFDDVAVGAQWYGPDTGRTYVVFGGFGLSVSTVADGVLDGVAAGGYFGYGLGGAGDVDGDLFTDLAVGAYYVGMGAGAVYFFRGGAGSSFDTGADTTLGGAAGSFFGLSVQ